MESLPKRTIARMSYNWAKEDNDGKAKLYEDNPKCREIFMELPDDKFFLFEKVDSNLWTELVRFDHSIVNQGELYKDLIAKILQKIPPKDAVVALLGMIYPNRRYIMEAVLPEYRLLINDQLMRYELNRMEKIQKNPKDKNMFTASPRFLEGLPPSAQTCSAAKCTLKIFRVYAPFYMTRCLKHSFHLACSTAHECI